MRSRKPDRHSLSRAPPNRSHGLSKVRWWPTVPARPSRARMCASKATRFVRLAHRSPAPPIASLTGLASVLAPGFIDAHNHSTDGLNSNPEADTQVSQGITTVLLGQDGSSPLPIRDYLARRRSQPAAVNVAMLVGHATVRRSVMGDDFRRESTTAEIAKMESLVDEASAEGAIGLSSGLEYRGR